MAFMRWGRALGLGVVLSAGVPTALAAQQAYLVFQPLLVRAEVWVDEVRIGTLGAVELTIEVSPGRHAVVVRADGYQEWRRSYTLRSDQVLPITVDLQPGSIRAIRETGRGATGQLMAPVRLFSLEPAIAPVEAAGVRTSTPVLLMLPVGVVRLRVAGRDLCIDVQPVAADTAVVRLRRGRVELMRGVLPCGQTATETATPLRLDGRVALNALTDLGDIVRPPFAPTWVGPFTVKVASTSVTIDLGLRDTDTIIGMGATNRSLFLLTAGDSTWASMLPRIQNGDTLHLVVRRGAEQFTRHILILSTSPRRRATLPN